jgi:cell wall-associated NlpC family hydrolase
MNRDLEKMLKEKWYLVAADFIAVLAILCLDLNPRDGLEAFLAVLGILGASLIVVIPVLMDGGDKRERLAEQARLRTALAAEIDGLRDDFRAGTEAVSRRVGEIEVTARQAGEAAAAAVAQRASAELNTLKAAITALEAKAKVLETAVAASGSSVKPEAVEELTTQVEALAVSVRASVADVDEAAEAMKALRTDLGTQQAAVADDLKKLREDLKKSGQKAAAATDKLSETLESVQAEVKSLQANPPAASAPSPSSLSDEEPEAAIEEMIIEDVKTPIKSIITSEAEVEVSIEEVSTEDEESAEVATAPAGGGTSLTINLMIGIGNKPYVRGTGPGLSQDSGQLMTFLGIGRWQWVSPEPDAPATVEIWKNDQTPMGEPLHLSGGEPVEVDESHFTGS